MALSESDSKIADSILTSKGSSATVFALRILNASSDFSTIANMTDYMEKLPCISAILGTPAPDTRIRPLVKDCHAEAFMNLAEETSIEFNLNADQKW